MSILIKYIDPPKFCNECPFSTHIRNEYNSKYIWCFLLHGNVGDATLSLIDKPFNCPIIPLPPNLIDVDKFKEDYHMGDDCPTCKQDTKSCMFNRVYSKMDFCSWLDDAERIGEKNE